MSKHKPNAIDPSTLNFLLSESSPAHVSGQLKWSVDRPRDVFGVTEVVTGVVSVDGCKLRVQYNTPRPWEVHFQYLGNAVAMRRVCVNGHTHGFSGRVHMHTYKPEDGLERTEPLAEFPMCDIGAGVSSSELRMMFEAFAALCYVDTTGITWNDPPISEGRQ